MVIIANALIIYRSEGLDESMSLLIIKTNSVNILKDPYNQTNLSTRPSS